MNRGIAIILSGPSGAGKSSVIRAVTPEWPQLQFSVSWTTRSPRPGEQDGVHYHFHTSEEFERARSDGEFLEFAEVHGNCYGTPRTPIFRAIDEGRIVLLDIDVQGARSVRRAVASTGYADSFLSIFMTVPSLQLLEERLRGRHTESEEAIERRMHNAASENSCWREYDYLIINDLLERSARELDAVIRAALCRTTHRHLY